MPNLKFLVILASMVLLGLLLQFEAIYTEYQVKEFQTSGVHVCFFSPYSLRWVVQLIGVLALGLTCS